MYNRTDGAELVRVIASSESLPEFVDLELGRMRPYLATNPNVAVHGLDSPGEWARGRSKCKKAVAAEALNRLVLVWNASCTGLHSIQRTNVMAHG